MGEARNILFRLGEGKELLTYNVPRLFPLIF
jgi:hypothetical protein